MNILVVNSGSSSLKFQLIDMKDEKVLAKGIVERIGLDGANLSYRVDDKKTEVTVRIDDHKEAINLVLKMLLDEENGVISSVDEIYAVGHRVVHGGDLYKDSVVIDEDVKNNIKECYKLAPLHNPANITGIEACEDFMQGKKMAAVFDTAFHGSISEGQYLYALPFELYEEDKIRKYGFHGTSHGYVSSKAAEEMGKDIKDLKIISCHLGNGASICAVKNGKSFDTTMGFTPLDGIIMGTRCGNIDPAILLYLMKNKGYTSEEIDNVLNHKSGVLGISGVSSDFRDIEKAAEEGNRRAQMALDAFYYSVKKNIGSYITAMEGIDAIIFTAGLGENSPETREACLSGLEFLGIEIDAERNNIRGQVREISSQNSKVKVFVIPTNEELAIARETLRIVQ